MDERARGAWITQRLKVSRDGLPILGCGWTPQGTWFFDFGQPKPRYVLKYREPGKRNGTERWAKRDVHSVQEAVDWMNANQDRAFLPASVLTRAWKPQTVAILN